MKHIRTYNNFRNTRNNSDLFTESRYYYNIGRKIQKSLFEIELEKSGYTKPLIESIDNAYSLKSIDGRIVDCLFESLSGKKDSLDLLIEEITLAGVKLPSFGDMYNKVSKSVEKGIEVGKKVVKGFKDFISSIGEVIKNLFEKVKAFFKKIWEMFKPNILNACKTIASAVGGGTPEKMKTAVDTVSSEGGQKEVDSLFDDIKKASGKFSSGQVGRMGPETEEHLKGEAEEYKGVTGESEIEKLIGESFDNIVYKSTVRKIYYSMKGYISEGGEFEEMKKVFEAEEKKEFKVGDKVTYTTKSGKEATKEILKIEGDLAYFKTKDGEDFSKKISDLKEPEEGFGKKLAGGVAAEQGIFGWLVESVGFIMSPLSKLKEIAIKGGTNGILTTISAISRGMKNAFKYVIIGTIAGLIYHIVHGLQVLTGDHSGGDESEPEIESPDESDKSSANTKPKINLKKESLEFILESATVNLEKPSKHTSFLDDAKGALAPIAGGLLFAVIARFIPIVKIILEIILVGIGIFEFIGAICNLKWVASKNLKVCKVQHNIHHIIEGSIK